MTTIVLSLCSLSLAIWVFLLLFWGQFWRCNQRLDDSSPPWSSGCDRPAVTVVIPARNEAETIGKTVRSLLHQDYDGPLTIVVVDDQSEDGTSDIVQDLIAQDLIAQDLIAQDLIAQDLLQEPRSTPPATSARTLTLVSGQPLPSGWTGKLWALEQGSRQAQATVPAPQYLLFTDADIDHAPDNLRQLVTKAEQEHLDLVSLMVKLRCQSVWETLLIPAFVFFFQKLYPFPWVNTCDRPTAAAAGGCILLRTTALKRIGGVAALRDALIDDCSLAALIKGSQKPHHPIWLGLTTTTTSLRCYDTLGSIWTMVARTAYTQLHYSIVLLLGTILGMTLVYEAAPLGLLYGLFTGTGTIILIAGVTWVLMAVAYGPTLVLYRRSPLWAFTLPFIALLYSLMTLDSARQHWQGKGGAWKGRVYPNQPS